MMDDVKDYPPYLDCPKPRKPMTNADRIRAMSDEELDEWMAECNAYRENANASQWLPWLKQPADEYDHCKAYTTKVRHQDE